MYLQWSQLEENGGTTPLLSIEVHAGAVHVEPVQHAEGRVVHNILVRVTIQVLVPLVGRGPQYLRVVAERSGRWWRQRTELAFEVCQVGHQDAHLCNLHRVRAEDDHFSECLREIGEAPVGPCRRHDTAAFVKSCRTDDCSAEASTAKLSVLAGTKTKKRAEHVRGPLVDVGREETPRAIGEREGQGPGRGRIHTAVKLQALSLFDVKFSQMRHEGKSHLTQFKRGRRPRKGQQEKVSQIADF